MQITKVSFRNTSSFSDTFLRYIEKDPAVQPFYHRFPDINSFEQQIDQKAKQFTTSQRTLLADTLIQQYGDLLKDADPVKINIDRLRKSDTYTVTTGHQLNVFTGPLYFLYKIMTVIRACEQLTARFPGKHFVPVYWMASEDHDYEEIKSFRLYGKKYTWVTQQQGAVGRFSLENMESLLSTVPGDISVFRRAYNPKRKLADAVRAYVHELFGAHGLVVIDADHAGLKKSLAAVMESDILGNKHEKLVAATQAAMKNAHLEGPVNAREINFFYLDGQIRSRLERAGEQFRVVDTSLVFSRDEMSRMIQNEPQKLSPNVVLRPLYQEIILPNLAYCGGPAELVYWLELKGIFDLHNVPYPILLPRNFALYIEPTIARKLQKTGLDAPDFFGDKESVKKFWVTRNSTHNLSLAEHRSKANSLFDEIVQQAKDIDTSLIRLVEADKSRLNSMLEVIEKKMIRAEKRRNEDKLRQIDEVKDALFPGGSLQERTDNFLNFYQQDPAFLKTIQAALDPFDFRFNLITAS